MSSLPVEFSIAPSAARDPYSERRPPYSEEAEQAVLSAMLMDQDAVVRASEHVDETMFYAERHRRMFRAMMRISSRGEVIDPITLADELGRSDELGASGGNEYIGFLVDAVPTAANVEYHARIVRERALRRRLIETGTTIVGEAFEGRSTAGDLVDHAEQLIFQLSQSKGSAGFSRIKEMVWPAMEKIEALQASAGSVTGVPTGFTDLDNLTQGFQPSDLVIVAARPSMGKTAFTLNIAQHAAIAAGQGVAFFSLEMSKEQLVMRMLASEARVDAQRLRNGSLRDDDWGRLAKAAGLLNAAPIWVDDTPGITIMEIRSRARRLKAEHDVKIVIIDYLQLIAGPQDSESRQQEVSYISRSLKILAKELGVPVVALSQLSRGPEQRTGENKRPQLSDLRESGAIEQDADVVMFLFRPEYYAITPEEKQATEGLAEVIIGKQRNGPVDTVKLAYQKQFTRFENLSHRQQ